jgi:predicted metal-dependent hydrolase
LRANQTIELLISESAIPEQNKKIVSELLHRLLSKIHLSAIEKRVHELNQIHFKAKIKDVKISHTRSRWGSCSKSGSIRISSRLLLAPPEVLDYVVIHELAHLREFNHSQHFWKLVSAAMPDYAEKEKWLKVNHYTCNF